MEQENTKPNFPETEEKVLRFWEKEKIFETSLERTKNGKPFVFFEGPPTANGRPGIHHVLSRAYKDVIPRYKTMRGFFVERKAGWDTHGLPVELEVEKQLKLSGKPDIEKYGIEKFNEKCKESVWKYKTEWEQMTKRIGFWLDLEHPYITYENTYIESLWWIIKQIWEKRLLYRGYKVVPHCPRCGTALSSHEVAQGYKEITEESVYVKFRLKDSLTLNKGKKKKADKANTFFLSWTTTPWTLPGNVALAVGKNISYVKVKQGDDVYILAKDRLTILDGKHKILEEMKGQDLVGIEYEPLYPFIPLEGKKAYYVAAADFVTIAEGTGIVHTAVMYGEDDYALGEKLGLPKHHTVDQAGRFTQEVKPWAGKFVNEAEKDIVADLRKRSLLYKSEQHKHSYPFCWRCDSPLLYYAKDSWFVAMSKLRKQLIANNQQVNWVPPYVKTGRFGEWLNEVKDWAFSRERYWGTPLPIWVCQQCQHTECLGSIDELAERSATKIDRKKLDLHRPYIDNISLTCSKCGGTMRRVPEVADVWFDSGAMPFAQWHYPFENKERVDSGAAFPAGYIAEAIDQTRGWFYTLLAVSTLLGKGPAYKNVVCLGHVLDAKGQKMSKSKGNVIDPFTAIKQYGSDPIRWHLFTMSQPGESKMFDLKGVEEAVKKHFLILWNVLSFYAMYKQSPVTKKIVSTNILDRWVMAKLNVLIADVTDKLEQYSVTSACREVGFFVQELSTWYIRRSRNRFKGNEAERDQALHTLQTVLLTVSKLLAPFTPFFAEHIYRQVSKNEQDAVTSVHLCSWPTPDLPLIDRKLLHGMDVLRKAIELGHALRKEQRLKVRQPLSQFILVGAQSFDPELMRLIQEELNVKEVILSKKLPKGAEFVSQLSGTLTVALDTTVTDELKIEGIVREFTRHINSMRKDARLSMSDVITLYYEIENDDIRKIFEVYGHRISKEVIAAQHLKGIPDNVDVKKVLDIQGKKVLFGIKKRS